MSTAPLVLLHGFHSAETGLGVSHPRRQDK
jgi:hypothetical protein